MKVNVPSMLRVLLLPGVTEKLVTGVDTETLHCAVSPLAVFAVMTALPFLSVFTRPALLTVATDVSELLHVTFLFVALEGVTVAVSFTDLLGARLTSVLSRDIPCSFMVVSLHRPSVNIVLGSVLDPPEPLPT